VTERVEQVDQVARLERVELVVNGQPCALIGEPRTLLVDALRHGLGLTGTHVGCEQGVCGACTVLWDGRPVRSCLVLAPQAEGARIETVESVGPDDPICRALHEHHGLQCGFCTAGIVMSLVGARRAGWTAERARDDALGGHLCRCTGYVGIRAAIEAAWRLGDGAADGDDAP
jgi:aerobic-type carbon monoxide dehydrogenase small subunit (CoxS/CutS family)